MDDFFALMGLYYEVLTELLATEKAKFEGLRSHDIAVLEASMKSEQAITLKLRGLDKKRELFLEARGLTGLSFSELNATLAGAELATATELFAKIELLLGELRSLNVSSRQYLELNLHSIELLLHKDAEAGIYQDNGQLQKKSVSTEKITRG